MQLSLLTLPAPFRRRVSAQNIPLDDFFQSTKGKVRTPLVQSWVAELTTQREARRESKEKK
jgi:hypothetical protein